MNFGTAALQVLRTVAPTIATAVGGPFAGMAVTKLEQVFGLTPNVNPNANNAAIEQALTGASPDQVLALTKANEDFQTQMKSLGIQEDKLVFDDIANARLRQVELKDSTPTVLAYIVVFLVILAEGSMAIWGQPKAIDGVVLGRVLGTLDAALIMVLSYYFGSSTGSVHKDATISAIASTK